MLIFHFSTQKLLTPHVFPILVRLVHQLERPLPSYDTSYSHLEQNTMVGANGIYFAEVTSSHSSASFQISSLKRNIPILTIYPTEWLKRFFQR
jgi:hypothetical protein